MKAGPPARLARHCRLRTTATRIRERILTLFVSGAADGPLQLNDADRAGIGMYKVAAETIRFAGSRLRQPSAHT